METGAQLYESIGGARYSATRTTEPRWMARIESALGTAETVINIGAGTGSYESGTRRVVAVDPSERQVHARARETAPAVRAVAEYLPFENDAFDAATAILTIHHWSNLAQGLDEARRVAGRIVIVTSVPGAIGDSWIGDYFPEIRDVESDGMIPLDRLRTMLGDVRIEQLPVPHDCIDGFFGAFWRRPAAYLDPTVRTAISWFSMIPPERTNTFVTRLRADLDTGAWLERYGELLHETEIDLGYRLVVTL